MYVCLYVSVVKLIKSALTKIFTYAVQKVFKNLLKCLRIFVFWLLYWPGKIKINSPLNIDWIRHSSSVPWAKINCVAK